MWIRQFGSTRDDFGVAVAADGAGNVFVAGSAGEPLSGRAPAAPDRLPPAVRPGRCGVVDGSVRHRRRPTTPGTYAVASVGNAYLVGATERALPGRARPPAGSTLSSAGTDPGGASLGPGSTAPPSDYALTLAVDHDGGLVIAGSTRHARRPFSRQPRRLRPACRRAEQPVKRRLVEDSVLSFWAKVDHSGDGYPLGLEGQQRHHRLRHRPSRRPAPEGAPGFWCVLATGERPGLRLRHLCPKPALRSARPPGPVGPFTPGGLLAGRWVGAGTTWGAGRGGLRAAGEGGGPAVRRGPCGDQGGTDGRNENGVSNVTAHADNLDEPLTLG